MSTKILRTLAAVLVAASFSAGSALVSAAPVPPPQRTHGAVAALPSGGYVVDKLGIESGYQALQVLIFIHRANLPVGGVVQGGQR